MQASHGTGSCTSILTLLSQAVKLTNRAAVAHLRAQEGLALQQALLVEGDARRPFV